MKLLLCKKCSDVIKLTTSKVRRCECNHIAGLYVNDLDAIYAGKEAVPLGIANSSLRTAVEYPPEPDDTLGKVFIAFVIPTGAHTFNKVSFNTIDKHIRNLKLKQK